MPGPYVSPLFHRLFRKLDRECAAELVEEDIRRNVESILNARLPLLRNLYRSQVVRQHGTVSGETLLEHSILNFGTVDFNLLSADDDRQRGLFIDSIEAAIRAYEPRLDGETIRVELTDKGGFGLLNLLIFARQVAPRRKPVTWQTGPGVNDRLYRLKEREQAVE